MVKYSIMSENNKSTFPETKIREQISQNKNETLRDLQNKLEKELSALLAHPLVPKEFKDVFEGKE